MSSVGAPAGPLGAGAGGEPTGIKGWSISISHKPDLAIALVGRAQDGALGVDLESATRPRPAIASHVLGPLEKVRHLGLPEERRWPELIAAFALKEATYKAVYPRVRRYVAFDEAAVHFEPSLRVELRLAKEQLEVALDAEFEVAGDRVVAMVRCRP